MLGNRNQREFDKLGSYYLAFENVIFTGAPSIVSNQKYNAINRRE